MVTSERKQNFKKVKNLKKFWSHTKEWSTNDNFTIFLISSSESPSHTYIHDVSISEMNYVWLFYFGISHWKQQWDRVMAEFPVLNYVQSSLINKYITKFLHVLLPQEEEKRACISYTLS